MSQAGTSFAYWLYVTHPAIYFAVARRMKQSGLGCYTCGSFGRLGQDDGSDIPIIDVTADSFDTGTISATDAVASSVFTTVDPSTFTPISVDATAITPPPDTAITPAASTDSSTLSKVGDFLTSSQGVSALLTVGAAAVKAAATVQSAQTQQSILQMQAARAAAGLNPAAVSYTVNPATGAVTPVIATGAGGTMPLTGAMQSALTPGTAAASIALQNFVSQYGLLIGLGFLALLALKRS